MLEFSHEQMLEIAQMIAPMVAEILAPQQDANVIKSSEMTVELLYAKVQMLLKLHYESLSTMGPLYDRHPELKNKDKIVKLAEVVTRLAMANPALDIKTLIERAAEEVLRNAN